MDDLEAGGDCGGGGAGGDGGDCNSEQLLPASSTGCLNGRGKDGLLRSVEVERGGLETEADDSDVVRLSPLLPVSADGNGRGKDGLLLSFEVERGGRVSEESAELLEIDEDTLDLDPTLETVS